jgi:hypothetical protein
MECEKKFDGIFYSVDADRYQAFQFDANSDTAFRFDADTDPAFHFDADPDTAFNFDAGSVFSYLNPDPPQSEVNLQH